MASVRRALTFLTTSWHDSQLGTFSLKNVVTGEQRQRADLRNRIMGLVRASKFGQPSFGGLQGGSEPLYIVGPLSTTGSVTFMERPRPDKWW